MTIHDRIALELGRAVIRAAAAEAALTEEQTKTQALLQRVADAERKPARNRAGGKA